MSRVPHWLGQAAGVSNPEIPDLIRERPQTYRHDREAFVPGGEFSSLWECDSFGIMKVSGLNTPASIRARIPASSGARSRPPTADHHRFDCRTPRYSTPNRNQSSRAISRSRQLPSTSSRRPPHEEVPAMAGSGDERAAGAGDRNLLRASDADREQVIAVLQAAFVAGRLTKDEFDLRLTLVFASWTHADLAVLTADIPARLATPQPPEPAREPDTKKLIQ